MDYYIRTIISMNNLEVTVQTDRDTPRWWMRGILRYVGDGKLARVEAGDGDSLSGNVVFTMDEIGNIDFPTLTITLNRMGGG